MADLARCNNTHCPKHELCYRYKTDAEQDQGYLVNFNEICNNDSNYIYYSPLEKKPEHQ